MVIKWSPYCVLVALFGCGQEGESVQFYDDLLNHEGTLRLGGDGLTLPYAAGSLIRWKGFDQKDYERDYDGWKLRSAHPQIVAVRSFVGSVGELEAELEVLAGGRATLELLNPEGDLIRTVQVAGLVPTRASLQALGSPQTEWQSGETIHVLRRDTASFPITLFAGEQVVYGRPQLQVNAGEGVTTSLRDELTWAIADSLGIWATSSFDGEVSLSLMGRELGSWTFASVGHDALKSVEIDISEQFIAQEGMLVRAGLTAFLEDDTPVYGVQCRWTLGDKLTQEGDYFVYIFDTSAGTQPLVAEGCGGRLDATTEVIGPDGAAMKID